MIRGTTQIALSRHLKGLQQARRLNAASRGSLLILLHISGIRKLSAYRRQECSVSRLGSDGYLRNPVIGLHQPPTLCAQNFPTVFVTAFGYI